MPERIDKVRDEVRSLIRAKGLRATRTRTDVLVVLHEAASPMTHEQVIATMGPDAYDKASIWRVLSDLAEAEILNRMDLGDRIWRYEMLDACRAVTDDHAHFLCEDCGTVSCLPTLTLRTPDGRIPEALRQADFRVRVSGRCAECVAG